MRTKSLRLGATTALAVLVYLAFNPAVHAQDNYWDFDGSDFWDVAGRWSLGIRPTNTHWVFITNATTKTVTIDAFTSGSFPESLTISNLTLSAPAGTVNTLLLDSPGLAVPLTISNAFTLGKGGVLRITNGAVEVQGSGSGSFFVDGIVRLDTGNLTVTNSWTTIGNTGIGALTNFLGRLSLEAMLVGYWGGSRGSVTLTGGTNQLLGQMGIGYFADSTGSVLVTGGQLIVTNSWTYVGRSGRGELTISNGLVRLDDTYLGRDAGSLGNLTVAGGQTYVTNAASAAALNVLRGTLTLTGGTLTVNQLILTNSEGTVSFADGILNSGGASIDNGANFLVGNMAGGSATWRLLGGTHSLSNGLWIATENGSTGTVVVSGGQLIATNATTYVGDHGIGQITVSNGLAILEETLIGYFGSSRGSLTVAGGTNQILGALVIAVGFDNTGSVLLDGGELVATNDLTLIGRHGVGQMTVSNGVARLANTYVGSGSGSRGSLTVAGGTNQILGDLAAGLWANSTGSVLVSGGTLLVTNASTYMGSNGVGQMTVSNGLARLDNTYVGYEAGSRGTLTVAGGTNQVLGLLEIGYNVNSTGSVVVTGGTLLVTNYWTRVGLYGVGQMGVGGGLALL